ncbi:hypothetical protein DPMN_035137 [Dreissena polymorpha]|uniref:Ubiquitin conjugation factor E4 A n=2 Tax=Dreissena polymorpha TaxID=45954 RepID=A0A9D4RMM0_DREPO|nr:hypothetical protein DPMN_035137 [Dreissena polymorpha]
MEFTAPDDWSKGSAYERTLLGSLLAMNPCPRGSEEECEFFSRNIMDAGTHETHTTIMFIWQRLNSICDDIHRMLKSIIKLSSELRHQVLHWIGRCLEANRGKTELWSAHDVEIYQKDFASDGFCLNLSQVLLQLCEPFSRPNSDMLLKVKATYCRVTPASDQEAKDMCVHAIGLDKEKTFVPYTEEQRLPQEKQYHFISECFFLTHQALHIAYSIVYKLYKLAGSIGRLKSLVDMMKEGSGYTRIVVLIKMQLNRELCWYYNMKAALTGFGLVKSCLSFHIATASWLVQIASRDEVTDFREIALPLANEIPKILSYVPEFILSNFTMFISSLEVFSALDVIKENKECLHQFMTVILVYMGSPRRLVNSNMRAQLAEAVESFVPELNESDGTYKLSASGYEDSVFKEHRLISHLAEAVLNVFVSIEMTGQSVDDERKFSYRKSMHKLLQYMWKIPAHKDAIKAVSKRAMTEMNNTEAPLFLRFVNLLINDAIFLLDEGLAHMRDIRDQELERDKGNWNKLSDEQMREKESGLRHLCMLGRYRNIMANHTIYTLEILTREIRDIFCHQVMVDRIAGMLNYFLLELVGPKQTNYKVKDRKEHEFKPEQIVADIAHIYVYLGDNAQFCTAVLEESRSFSERLFTDAVKVLQKIGIAPEFVVKFSQLHEKLKSLQCSRQQEEEALGEAPEDFLDPIMGTLMEDPVILPETKTNIDRSVINRHLLSDQRDPFTKSPLSMNMVIPNLELKQRIEQWKLERLGHS